MIVHQVRLTKELSAFIDRQVESGRYQDSDEVLRAGLRLLERQAKEDERKLEILRKLAAEATEQLDRGEGTLIENPAQLKRYFAAIGLQAACEMDFAEADE